MNITIALFCVVIVPFAVGIFFLVRYFNSGKKKNSQSTLTAEKRTSRKGWQIWILYIGIAFILSVWTIWGALFFLATVWLLRMNPASDASLIISDNEKKTARRIYTWLFFSPLSTIPLLITLLLNSSYESTPSLNQIVPIVLISALPHAFLLLGLSSKSVFVYRHTQQGILMIALRAGMAVLAINSLDSDMSLGLGIFFLGNGLLWLFGSLIGWSQISHGESWFMQGKGETPITSDAVENLPAQKHIEQSQVFIHRYKPDEAKKHALAAFRSRDREIKAQAVKLLRTLDEVEKF